MSSTSEYTSYVALGFSALSLLLSYRFNLRSTKLSMLAEVFVQLFSDETRLNRYKVREQRSEFDKLKRDPNYSLLDRVDEAGKNCRISRYGTVVTRRDGLTLWGERLHDLSGSAMRYPSYSGAWEALKEIQSDVSDLGNFLKAQTFIPATLLVLCITLTPAHAFAVAGPNVDITVSTDTAERQQVEPSIAVDPHNPSIIVAGAQDYRLLASGGHRWHGYYRSIDAGQTWSVMLLPGYPGDNSPQGLASPLHGVYSSTSDPVLAFDRSGNVYYVGITAAATLTSPTGFNLFVAKFVNDGANYAFTTLLPPSLYNLADKPWITVDTSAGPRDGTVYVTYDTIVLKGAVDSGVALVRSTDGGVTYSLPVLAINQGFFSGVTVDTQGRVFVSSLTPGRSKTSSNIAIAVSTDGGLNFRGHEIATHVSLLPSSLPGNSFRVFTTPQIASDNHGVYMVWDDFGKGNSNVMFTESTDGGIAWANPVQVNDVTSGQHFFSTLAVSGGIISIAWYDSRLGQLPNGFISGLDVFYAESNNGGHSFSSNLRVTSVSFNPNIVERADFGATYVFMGDYIQVAASPSAAHVIWTDNRDACSNIDPIFGCTNQDIFTSTITV